jgi:Protein of unknown function (DUF3105)
MSAEPAPTPPHRRLRRLGAIALTLLVAIAGAVVLLLVFEGRDSSQVRQQAPGAAGTQGPGRLLPDQGDARLAPGQPRPRYLTEPPASGAHRSTSITTDADGTRLSDDQLLEALSLGDVVLLYGGPHPPAGLRALADRIAGPFDAALAASGQAVVLARRDGTNGITALAWRHELQASKPNDPALASFADYWIGRGAPS